MNSTEEISVYKDSAESFHSPSLQRRTLGCSYDFPEKSAKKDKKWSISSIFRRKKKEESESSSEEDVQKTGFLGRRKKKSENRRKRTAKPAVPFDHIVLHPGSRNSLSYNGYNYGDDIGVLSDPTAGFSNFVGRALPQIPPHEPNQKFSRDLSSELFKSNLVTGSVDSVRKSKRVQTKARAEARRTSSKNGSSSEEDSQRSNSSLKIRSEENLKIDKYFNKKSRAARTERYLKRHSRDGENPHNYLRLSKSDVENSTANWKYSDDNSARSPSRSPLVPKILPPTEKNHKLSFTSLNSQSSNISGLSTIPPSHANYSRYRISNSTSNPSYKPPQSMNDYNNSIKKQNSEKYFTDQRSVSCDANIHKTPSAEFPPDVLHVQFPVMRPKRGFRNLSLIDTSQINHMRQPPPPPPPRDPNRTVGHHYFESGRPSTFYFDNSGGSKSKLFTQSFHNEQNLRKLNPFNLNPSYRSTSEDQLTRNSLNVQLQCRPSSTTPDSCRSQRLNKHDETNNNNNNNPEEYNYLMDKQPRSRKPIFIKPGGKVTSDGNANKESAGGQKALNFWKEIDRQNSLTKQTLPKNIRSESPQMFTSHTHVQTKVFLPHPAQNETNPRKPKLNPSRFGPPKYEVTQVPLKDDITTLGAVSKEDIKRKSANLEEALHELEVIYNSLKLGDEDLLERAEQREKESRSKEVSQDIVDSYPSYSSRGALSDSNFTYEPFDTVDSPRRKRLSKKNGKIDLKLDDMAFRKLNKDRANTIGDPQSVVSQVSYLTRSPVFARSREDVELNSTVVEPDVTLDDVVYRNVKHSNSSLKIVDPQPPFGIPLGPITPAANSDYLHAKPENLYAPSFKHKKIPDVVKDDLAFRNLRKDANKGPALPQLSGDDFGNNNSEANLNYLKKKRAQRSMSANIGNILGKSFDGGSRSLSNNNGDADNEFKTLTDIADAMEIARRVLKEKENKICATKKAFMSDTDAGYAQPEDTLKESRLNFLNGLRQQSDASARLGDDLWSSKPPRGLTPDHRRSPKDSTPDHRRSPKDSTPIPASPLEDKKYVNDESTSSSLDDLLNALAEEAKETTQRINEELRKLSEDKDGTSYGTADSLNEKLSEIDAVSEQAKKLLDNVVDSTNLITSEKNDEEEVRRIEVEPAVAEAATLVMSRFEPKDEAESAKDDSEHDYENMTSDNELNVVDVTNVDVGNETSLSPFEEHKADLIASFQELKEKVDEINFPIKREKEATDSSSKMDSIYDNLENDSVTTGEEQCAVVALPIKECAFSVNTNPVESCQTFTSSCDIILRRQPPPFNSNFLDDSETSSGFHSNCSCGEGSHYLKSDGAFDGLDSLESLKSPKLVLETSNKVSNKPDDLPESSKLVMKCLKSDDVSLPGTSHDVTTRNAVDTFDGSILDDDTKPCPSWYRDPTTVAFACSYGVACVHQLASLDLFAVLSILFAVLSFIAALFL